MTQNWHKTCPAAFLERGHSDLGDGSFVGPFVEIQRGAQSGSVIAREGWSLGLREEYRTSAGEGELVLAGLPRGDWGVECETSCF